MTMVENKLNWVKLSDDLQMSDDFDLFYSPDDKTYFAYRNRHEIGGFSFCIEARSRMAAVSDAQTAIEEFVLKQEEVLI